MPKVSNTRRQRAAALVARVQRGPEFSLTFLPTETPPHVRDALTPSARKLLESWLSDRYRIWAETWVTPELIALVPELKAK